MIKKSELSDRIMDAYIVQNPHTKDPKKMIEMMQSQIDEGPASYKTDEDAKPDAAMASKMSKFFSKKR